MHGNFKWKLQNHVGLYCGANKKNNHEKSLFTALLQLTGITWFFFNLYLMSDTNFLLLVILKI